MSVLGSLVVRIVGDNSQFNKTIAQTQKQLNASTKGLQTVAKSMTTVGDSMVKGITVPILAVGAGLLKLGSDFDDAYDKIRIDTGATGDALIGLQNDFRAVAKVAPSSFNDISTAVSGYNKTLGLAGEANQKLSTQVLNLSRLTKTDLNANVENSSKLFNNWKISTENQGAALDLMFRASQKAKISVTDLMAEVSSSGPILRTMGYDFETSTALIAGFQKAGIEVQSTVAAMKIALKTMAKEGFTDPQEVLKTYIDRIKNAKTDIEAVGIAAELFGARGGAAMAAAIREGRLNLDDLVASLKTGTETINNAAKATDDWKEKLILLKNNLGIALEPLATKVFDSITRGVEKVTPKIEELAKWFGELSPAMQDNLIKYGLIAAALPLVVSGLGRAVTGAIQLRNALLLLNTAVTGNVLFKAAGLTSGALASAVVLIGSAANRLGNLTKAFALNEVAAMSWNDRILEIVNVALLGIPEILNALTRVIGLPAKEFEFGYGAMIKAIFEGKPVVEAATVSIEDQAKAYNDALSGITAYKTVQHEGIELTTEQKIAYQDNKTAIESLMAQYPELTREEAEAQLATEENTGAIDEQVQSLNDLISALWKIYNINQSVTEATWDFNDAVAEAEKVMKDSTSTDREKQAAIFSVQDSLENLQSKIAEGIELDDLTIEQQGKLQESFLETGAKAVEMALMSKQEFQDMADKLGINQKFITDKLLGLDNSLDTSAGKVKGLRDYLDSLESKNITVNTFLNTYHHDYFEESTHKAGVVSKAGGGIVDHILSASAGIKLPKFDNGGVLAMLHPPEIVLNAKEAMQLVWNMATRPIDTNNKNAGINNTYNITSPKPLSESEIKRQIDLYSRELGYRTGLI
jgi:hypothetical protein